MISLNEYWPLSTAMPPPAQTQSPHPTNVQLPSQIPSPTADSSSVQSQAGAIAGGVIGGITLISSIIIIIIITITMRRMSGVYFVK